MVELQMGSRYNIDEALMLFLQEILMVILPLSGLSLAEKQDAL